MSIPFSHLRARSTPSDRSLGDSFSALITSSGQINSLLDCLCSTSEPLLHSSYTSQPPLRHEDLRSFVSTFSLPHSHGKRLGPNDRVMLVLPTGPESAVALLALTNYHTCVPVNASCTASELHKDVQRLNAKAVLTNKDVEDRLGLRHLHEDLGCEIIYVKPRSSGRVGLFDLSLIDDLPFSSSCPSQLQGLADQALVLHTSGTSGTKKVVPYRLISLIVGTLCVVHSWDLRPTDVNINMMPLFHIGGIVRNLLAPMMSGGSAIMCSGFDPLVFWVLSAKFKATWYYAAPTIHHAILASQPDSGVSLQDIHIRMICNAAGGLVPSLAARMKDTFRDAVILPSYGMTECMPITSPPTNYQLDRPGSSGIACGPHLSIRDPADMGRQLSCGTIGAICVRGIPTFEGYEISPNISVPLDKSMEGWFDSGDVGYMDIDGHLYITGRSKEIINRGGEVISPFEIEEAVMVTAKDSVKGVVAFAIEHDILQECIGVAIVPMPTQPRISLLQLQDRLRDYLHPSKWPFAIIYMDHPPQNSVGKPQRINLASRLGVGCLSDTTPVLSRHFEAVTPSMFGSLTDPIPCSKVSVDLREIDDVLRSIPSVQDSGLRFAHDETIEGFLSVSLDSQLEAEDVKMAVSRVLPGYYIPDTLHILKGVPLVRREEQLDFEALQNQASDTHALAMSQLERLVCDIFASLLPGEIKRFNRDSDFFLMGGNSLLLGKLSYHIRKQSGANVAITTLFNRSMVKEIATLIEADLSPTTTVFDGDSPEACDDSSHIKDFEPTATRDQTHPLNMIVQAVPLLFYPLRSAMIWSILLFVMSLLLPVVGGSYWQQLLVLLTALAAARLCVAIICPLAAVAFKWIVIGKYKKGTHRMWSAYYLRWWIVEQCLRSTGKGIFYLDPSLEIIYYRMLGARIGKNVIIDPNAVLGEFDLLDIQDDCRIDTSQIRGFCVERNGFFRLDHIHIGHKVVVNTYTVISPGAVIPDGSVYGPHASSHDEPSPASYAAYNRTLISLPHWLLTTFVAWPLISLVWIISYLPWFVAIALMMKYSSVAKKNLNSLESLIFHFASPRRVALHLLSVVARAVLTPLIHLVLGIAIKRLLGLNTACPAENDTQLTHLRRYLNSVLLSQEVLHKAFIILGSHSEIVSIVYRAMGAKIGRRIYWPGTGIYCPDPEMLSVGDDVVFGAYSECFTVDQIGSGRIAIGDGAMIADRTVLLPGTTIGRCAVMGSGSLGRRNATYEDGSTWIGNDNGEAVCLSKGFRTAADSRKPTSTPFGRAVYENGANYLVIPYVGVLATNIAIIALSALYGAVTPVVTLQLLRLLQIYFRQLNITIFGHGSFWQCFFTLYGLIAVCFIVIVNIVALGSMLLMISTKWMLLGQRHEGHYDWDKSSYNQRWQVHLTLHSFLHACYGTGGVLGPLTGSVYIVWYYRALGGKIGRNCFIYAGHKIGFMTEPDLVELGDNVNLDDCSAVAHINSRGNFSLNRLKVANGCAMRADSRLLSGASMEDNSLLCEHTLLTSGEVAESSAVYVGWPATKAAKGSGLSRT